MHSKPLLNFAHTLLLAISFTALFFGSNLAQAGTCEQQFKKVQRTAEEIFSENRWSTYQYGRCHQNVLRLMKRFEEEGLPVDQMQIVILTGFNGTLRNPRGGGWYFHAVLKWGDQIFDYDSARHPISVYAFKNQWHPLFEQPFIKSLIIPAAAYRAASAGLTGDTNNGALIDAIVRMLPLTPSLNLSLLGPL